MSSRLQNGTFYGRAGEPLRIDDSVLTETAYGAGFVVPVHSHSHPFFCLVLEGGMVEHFERRGRLLAGGSAFYHPAEAEHAETFEGGAARLFNMQLGGGWLGRMAGVGVSLPDRHVPLGHGRAPWLAAQLHDEFRYGRERLVLEGLLVAMVGELVRTRTPRERRAPGWMQRVVERLHDSAAPDVGLVELARIAQAHPSTVARTFRAVHGCTIGQYVRQLRVRRACAMLQTGGEPLSRIALACGFTDQSHFTRVFRQVTGSTPAAFRREKRTATNQDERER